MKTLIAVIFFAVIIQAQEVTYKNGDKFSYKKESIIFLFADLERVVVIGKSDGKVMEGIGVLKGGGVADLKYSYIELEETDKYWRKMFTLHLDEDEKLSEMTTYFTKFRLE